MAGIFARNFRVSGNILGAGAGKVVNHPPAAGGEGTRRQRFPGGEGPGREQHPGTPGLAPQVDALQGAATVAAIREFDLDLSQVHWDLTSVVLQGEYPPEEQQRDYAKPAYGFGGEPHCKQLRVGELVTNDGGVPVWHRSFDGQQARVGTVVAQTEAFRAQVSLPECLVIGDSKLLSAAVIGKLRRQQWHF